MRTLRRTNLKIVLAVVIALLCGWAIARADLFNSSGSPAVKPVAEVSSDDDAGDQQATTSYDGPMVRQRVAIALHVAKGADRGRIQREMRRAAGKEKVGPLSDATFAVFSEDMLNYLVPEMTVVLPEGATTEDGEVLMRDHTFTGVSFYLVQNVLVHDLTFAVIPHGVSSEQVKAKEDAEGVLDDSLNHYTTTVQRSGVIVRYLGAIISDRQIQAVREAMARAAGVTPAQVAVEATEPGPGVDLSNGTPLLTDDLATHHHH
jgi:hypothetical protein